MTSRDAPVWLGSWFSFQSIFFSVADVVWEDSGVYPESLVSVRISPSLPEPGARAQFVVSGKLPKRDIAVTDCRQVPDDFHARYSCTGKRYLYQINNSPVKDPFRWKQVYDYRYPIDVAMCDRQCKDFIGTHDFSSFCSAGSSVEDHVRTVTACGMVREGDRVTFYVEGDGFLYNMVRIMVGTILEIAAGSKPQGCIPQILEQRDRAAAGFTAPAWGLYLDRVFYEQLPDDRMEG